MVSAVHAVDLELSMGWVDPWVGLGRGSETFQKILKLLVGLYIMFVICIKVISDKLSLTVIY